MSSTIWRKSPVASGWKTMPATPRVVMPCCASSPTYAVEMAKSRSGAGPLTLRLPSSASRKPMPPSLRGALQLGLQAREGLDALLHRRVGGEEVVDRVLHTGGDDVEGVHLRMGAQVGLRDALHRPADLQQRRGQGARAAGDDRGAAVGRELAVARQRLQQEERDHVDGQRDKDDREDPGAVVVVVTTEEEPELDDHR